MWIFILHLPESKIGPLTPQMEKNYAKQHVGNCPITWEPGSPYYDI